MYVLWMYECSMTGGCKRSQAPEGYLYIMWFNFHPLEVAARYRYPQLQVGKNYLYM